jgi:hypothetical protein
MKTRHHIPCLLLLLLTVPAWGQSPPQPAGGEVHRPLNLSVPRDVAIAPGSVVINGLPEASAEKNLREDERKKETPGNRRPYGTGYEARMRDFATDGGFAGGRGGGMGGWGGRGGMGRGR